MSTSIILGTIAEGVGSSVNDTSELSKEKTPSSAMRLFPSMHTLSKLNGIEDDTRYSKKMTTHFDVDVGIFNANTAYIGRGSQFDVRKVALCCDRGYYVQKSALARFMESSRDGGASDQLIRAVFLEYRALSHAPIRRHPNVVNLLDLGWETDPNEWKAGVKWPVLILEYADQGMLTTFLDQSRLSLETKAKLCLDVARGLKVLHNSGIIHGDLKMENILVFTNQDVDLGSVGRYTAKLGDFGASLVELDGKRLPSFTRPWQAPECFGKLDYLGLKQFDTYSFGLLYWAVMLDGKDPFTSVKTVADCLSPEDREASLERLKKAEGGTKLLELAAQSLEEAFSHKKPPLAVITSTLQLDPGQRDLPSAVAALAEYLVSQG